MNRRAIGDSAERLACEYLQQRGLQLLQRNFHCKGGEIDLVMQHGDSLVGPGPRHPLSPVPSGPLGHRAIRQTLPEGFRLG